MGGFKPSRADIAGSTIVGSDLTVDTHQFTGSVDITGSLTLNGSSVTGGGGGGAVATYTNAGNDRVITSVNADTINGEANLTFNGTSLTSPQVTASVSMKAAVLEVSSSAEGALFRVDHATQSGAKPILFVTGSGLVGIGTAAPREDSDNTNRVHILGEEGADQGQNPVDNTLLMLENNNHAGIQFMTPIDKSGMLVWGDANAARVSHLYYHHSDARWHFDGATYGDEAMTVRSTGDSVNIGSANAAHMITNKAALHISSSTGGNGVGGPVLLRADHSSLLEPALFVTGSGRVGIGTDTPETTLEVRSTTTQQKWSYDDDHEFTITVGDDGETILAVSGTTTSPSPASDLVLDVSKGGDIFFRRQGDRLRFGISTGETIVQVDNQNTDLVYRVHPDGGLGAVGTEIFRLDASGAGALLVSGTIAAAGSGGNAPINFRDTATNIHSPGSNRLALTAPTLEISGTTRMSGAFGSTMVETITDHLQVSATTGLTIIDASSSLAVNNTLVCSIANGTFVGQQKNIRGMIVSGSTLAASTGIMLTGSNIDTFGNFPIGQVTLTGSNPASGPLFQRAGCQLVWGGAKWLPVGNFNFNINGTGRQF